MDDSPVSLEFVDDPARFLALAGVHLAAEPVLSTVVASVAARYAEAEAAGRRRDPRDWFLVVRAGGEIVGSGMRTAPFAHRPPFLLPVPDEAAVLLARTLHERGEELAGINGALPAARTVADETARLVGGRVRVAQHTRLFELRALVEPRPVTGRLRLAGADDLDLVACWFTAFAVDADQQAGRAPGTGFHDPPPREDLLRRIEAGQVWFWVDEDGERVHLSAANAPAYGVARIGPVYTPPEQRGRGWASAAVAAVSRSILAAGARPCLFTDQANPTSNRVYTALGYEAVTDMANLVIDPQPR